MKRVVLVILLLCLLVPYSEAQLWKMRRYEAAAGFGPSMFFGDIGGFSKSENILGLKDMSFLQTRYNLNLNLKYRITREINARFSLTQGILHASDSRGSNPTRGFDASISIIEPAVLGEYYIIKNSAENSYLFAKGQTGLFGGIMGSLDVYAFTGFGLLTYSIKPNDKLSIVMDSQGYKTKGSTVVIPVGIGASLAFSPTLNFGVEFGGRYSFSDNLDGYTSQFSSSNDVYYFLNLTVTYKLKTSPKGFPTFR